MQLFRRIFFFVIVVIIVVSLTIPCFAASSYSYEFVYDSELSGLVDASCQMPPVGNYTYILGNGVYSFSGSCSVSELSEDGVVIFVAEIENLLFYFVSQSDFALIYDTSHMADSGSFFLELTPVHVDTLGPAIVSGVDSVISWAGFVLTALVSGSLAPLWGLMAISIAVSAVFLVIKIIRSFTWGV